jgi:hypothetical protein
MEPVFGNHLGMVISNNDPEGRKRVQVFIPYLTNTLFADWNNKLKDVTFRTTVDLQQYGVLDRLKQTLPWAEYAAPMFGGATSVTSNSSTGKVQVNNTGTPTFAGFDAMGGVSMVDTSANSVNPNSTALLTSNTTGNFVSSPSYNISNVLYFGATAYGNADIDTTTALEINNGTLKKEDQFMGNKGNMLTPGYSIANNKLPHGTIVRIIDKKTGKPVGQEYGNSEGIFRVDDTGGSQVNSNIDFYSGSNKSVYDNFASLGKNTKDMEVQILDIKKGSKEEADILNNLKKSSGNFITENTKSGGSSGSSASSFEFAAMKKNDDKNATAIEANADTSASGSPNGTVSVPNESAKVWVFFYGGDIQRPVYFASAIEGST